MLRYQGDQETICDVLECVFNPTVMRSYGELCYAYEARNASVLEVMVMFYSKLLSGITGSGGSGICGSQSGWLLN